MSFHVGETFGDYQITGIIGAGSMGQVFQAEHRITKRKEAVKVVAAEYAAERQIQRFQREIAVHAGLNHPNIAAVHNALHIEGRFVLVLEYIEGQTLEHLLQSGRLPLEMGIDYISQTLEALSYAHVRGVIHRDVTPANLIITSKGTVKLTDFGVAKAFGDVQLTNCGEVVGSLQYMAPEQIRGDAPPDPRSDLYSVGAILYEVVTGTKPFDESTVIMRLTQEEPERKRATEVDESIQAKWDVIIERALAKDVSQRYQTADEFLRALNPDRPIVVAGANSHGANRRARLKIVGAASAAVLALLFAAGGWAVSALKVPESPQAITFRIGPPELSVPLKQPVKNTRLLASKRKKAKRQVARRAQKKKDAQAASAAPYVIPAPPVLEIQSQVPVPLPQPPTAATTSESISQNSAAPQKKRFWGKLNPFRKKKAETALGPAQN